MKTDNYLSLCLEQAAKSPLHYHHGCIIVRGGKVIGQGYNDYRPGYDGGSLKHGRVANSALDGPAIADLKEKLKKQKDKPKEKQQHQKYQTFVPFEGTGGGHGANTPLSMHSEMMAIHSALSTSSTLSSTALSSKKPCFKLPSGDKRKARLRREALAAYVNAVCETATRAGQIQILHHQACNNNVQQEDVEQDLEDEDEEEQLRDEERRSKDKSRAFQAALSGEKHCPQKGQKNGKKKGGKKGQYEYQYDRYGQQTQQQHSQRRPSVSKKGSANTIRGYDLTNTKSTSNGSEAAPGSLQHEKHKKDYKRSGKMRTPSNEPPQPEPLLLPNGRTSSSSRSVTDREKHPRLNGADIYVARLGWCRTSAERLATAPNLPPPPATAADPDVEATSADEDDLASSTPSLTSGSGSLHDELINRQPSPTRTRSSPRASNLDISSVRASRPCYRCITYMHSVGIKRVFWTNDAGTWEGGKVRDLIDALDKSMENVALKDGPGGMGGPTGNGVFVTKHEVLMLKRAMGRKEGVGS